VYGVCPFDCSGGECSGASYAEVEPRHKQEWTHLAAKRRITYISQASGLVFLTLLAQYGT
jgi:hypothetical protein